jgi:predicted nuclease of restriction endonuclease-like (RecB) superfamily
VIDQLSKDLRSEFPEMKGFSKQNLKYMKRFAQEYDIDEIGQQAVDQIPWGHLITLIYDEKDKQERAFYINGTVENGWSRNILSIQIETNLFKRQGSAITNFNEKLAAPHSDLAHATLKNPYLFDFLSLGKDALEREVEKGLVAHIEKFLLELGDGFAFLGRQYHLQVEDQDFYIDLLFYHIKLRSFVVIELKSGKFKPEYAGKMNFYLSAVDDLLRHPGDNPSIGLILCRSKVGVLAEYTLRDMTKPIGLAEYRLDEQLPDNIKTALPTIEELEAELSKDLTCEMDE